MGLQLSFVFFCFFQQASMIQGDRIGLHSQGIMAFKLEGNHGTLDQNIWASSL